jgi:hypothetical protein
MRHSPGPIEGYSTGAMQDLVYGLPKIHLLKLSEKSRARSQDSATGCREGPFGLFRAPHTGQIHRQRVARTLFGQFLYALR